MKSRALNILTVLNELYKKKERDRVLQIVETGTLRNISEEYAIGDGHSTLYIAEWVKDCPDTHFVSIDLDVRVCNQYLEALGLRDYVELVESDSLTYLANLTGEIDLFYLDSMNDADHIFKEYQLARTKLKAGGVIIIDDVVPYSPVIKKGHKVLPYLQKHGIKHHFISDQQIIIYE
jgi:predicted O-methyltransferase YrrM